MYVQDVLPRDAIPSIDDPSFDTAYFGDDGDEAVVVDADPPRAYPIRILSYHEIVNDVLGDSSGRKDGSGEKPLPIAPATAGGGVRAADARGRFLSTGRESDVWTNSTSSSSDPVRG
jgi:hypothetical protein